MNEPIFSARLMTGPPDSADLALDVGGGKALVFFRSLVHANQE